MQNVYKLQAFMLSALLHWDFIEFVPTWSISWGIFLVRIAWNPKVNFTYSAISGDLLFRIATEFARIAQSSKKTKIHQVFIKYFRFIPRNNNSHMY